MKEFEENFTEATEDEMDKIMGEADLMAAADKAASGQHEADEKEEKQVNEEQAAAEAEQNPFEVPFSREYDWDRKKISSINMSGLADFTTMDGEYLDRVLANLGHFPANKFKDTTYTKHAAARATGLPLEFFNQLHIRDMLRITSKVYNYFLFG